MWRQLQIHITTNGYRRTWLSHYEAILYALVIRDRDLVTYEIYATFKKSKQLYLNSLM